MADVCVITGGARNGTGGSEVYAQGEDSGTGREDRGKTAAGHRGIEGGGTRGLRQGLRHFEAGERARAGRVRGVPGRGKNVINSAGLSPNMAEAETILRVNALGTVYMNEEFSKVMKAGQRDCGRGVQLGLCASGFSDQQKV